jgi:hypothetical protein
MMVFGAREFKIPHFTVALQHKIHRRFYDEPTSSRPPTFEE